jgi:hypothetical protein
MQSAHRKDYSINEDDNGFYSVYGSVYIYHFRG